MTRNRFLFTLLADLVCVLAFALGGKSSHEAHDSNWIVFVIAWPYAVAAALAHAGLLARGRTTSRVWPEGAVIVGITYVLGMILRAISGRGIAVGFLIVAIIFLAVTMLGWRAIAAMVSRSPRRA